MAYHLEKITNGEQIVWDGFEKGIAPSPHKGFGDMKNVNLSTETGEAMANYIRTQQSQVPITGQALNIQTSTSLLNNNSGASQQLQNGTWITISGSSGTPANGSYYVSNVAGTTAQTFQISASFKGATLSGFTGSVGTFSDLKMNTPRAHATEYVADGSYRYYILDANGYVWVHDTNDSSYVWANINGGDATTNTSPTLNGNVPNGMAVYNGRLQVFTNSCIFSKPTSALSTEGTGVVNKWAASLNSTPLNTSANSNANAPHYALVGHDSVLYYCDGAYVGSILANATGNVINLFSYASYTAASTTVTLGTVYGGNVPIEGLPLYFYPSAGGAIPSALSDTTTPYYVKTGSLSYQGNACTFQVAATPSGSALDMSSGASGTQYFNTYNPTATASYVWSRQAIALPITDTAQCLAELGTQLVIGTSGNTLFIWDRVSGSPQSYILLPENNVATMVTTNNMVHVFAGRKGNIYITNGSTASLVMSVPDYITGQIEPYYTWGGSMYLRGRVYFSIMQNSGTPNTGGIWSFVPTQNFFIGQDFGVSLRLENENSYGTYRGVADLLIPIQNQAVQFPQYYSAWDNGFNVYGIDGTGTAPYATGGTSGQPIIETDIVPTGTMLDKKTFSQLEYKLSAPLVFGESVQIKYRTSLTGSWNTPSGSVVVDAANGLSGYFVADFEKSQWLQLQVLLTSTASNPSFVRLIKLYAR